MLGIKRRRFTEVGHDYDYELEDGTYLHESEWNGEVYTVKVDNHTEKTYRPVYDEEDKTIGFE